MRRLLLLLASICILFNSCANQQNTTSSNNDNEKWLNVRCFQTIDNTSDYSLCLASGNYRDAYLIIHFTCPSSQKSEIYYDGKQISGYFVLVGTYTYDSEGNGRMTVPAYMTRENVHEWYNFDKEALIRLLDIILSYNSIK